LDLGHGYTRVPDRSAGTLIVRHPTVGGGQQKASPGRVPDSPGEAFTSAARLLAAHDHLEATLPGHPQMCIQSHAMSNLRAWLERPISREGRCVLTSGSESGHSGLASG